MMLKSEVKAESLYSMLGCLAMSHSFSEALVSMSMRGRSAVMGDDDGTRKARESTGYVR
jgi:hypothetical protein